MKKSSIDDLQSAIFTMPDAHIIRDFPFEIDERSVLRHQGYKKSSKVSDRVRELLDEAVAKAVKLSRPRGIWKLEKIIGPGKKSSSTDIIGLSGGFDIESKLVSKLLRGCVEVALIAVTVGSEPEDEARRLMEEGDAAEAVMLDGAAGEAAEGCVKHINMLLQREAHRRGLHLTPRFSPGYGDWLLESQLRLFDALDPARIGVTLTESCVMIPRKSISAIVGLGPIDKIRTGASPCRECKPKKGFRP